MTPSPATSLRGVVARCVDALVERDCFDRAFRLCLVHADWERAAKVLASCCRHGHVEVPPEVVTEWLAAFPKERWEEPDGLLLRGLAGRVTDPFGPATAALLERAVDRYRAEGNVAGEVAAGVELVFVLRNQGRCDALPAFLARAAELDAAGHAEAAGPAAVARALFAELSGDDRQMVTVLDSIPNDRLSRGWSAVVASRLAIAHLTLGNEHEMLEAATRCAALADGSTDRHVMALARWFAGDPNPALAACDDLVADTARGHVGAVMLGTIATMVLASAGRTDEAGAQLALTEQAAASSMSALLGGALVGVRALLAAAMGDDEGARLVLEAALDDVPLSDPLGWRRAMRWLPLAYVLLPSIRESLDHGDVGPIHQRRLAVARAVVAARERPAPMRDLGPMTTETIATSVPLPWAMALAARLAADGNCRGRQIAEGLFELYGEPAKDALRGTMSDPVRRIAEGRASCWPRSRSRLGTRCDSTCSDRRSCGWPTPTRSATTGTESGCGRCCSTSSSTVPFTESRSSRRSGRTSTAAPPIGTCASRSPTSTRFSNPAGRTVKPCSSFASGDRPLPWPVDRTSRSTSMSSGPSSTAPRTPITVGCQPWRWSCSSGRCNLWRGPCLSDVAYEEWAQAARCELTARFIAATLRVAELHLAGGRTRRAAERPAACWPSMNGPSPPIAS